MMTDLISRQAAIDEMRELPYGYRGIVWNILNSLPSTKQPGTCEFWDDESNFCALHRPSAQPEPKSRLVREIEGLTQEETYDFLDWLLHGYGLQYTDSRQAVIEWLRGEQDGSD